MFRIPLILCCLLKAQGAWTASCLAAFRPPPFRLLAVADLEPRDLEGWIADEASVATLARPGQLLPFALVATRGDSKEIYLFKGHNEESTLDLQVRELWSDGRSRTDFYTENSTKRALVTWITRHPGGGWGVSTPNQKGATIRLRLRGRSAPLPNWLYQPQSTNNYPEMEPAFARFSFGRDTPPVRTIEGFPPPAGPARFPPKDRNSGP